MKFFYVVLKHVLCNMCGCTVAGHRLNSSRAAAGRFWTMNLDHLLELLFWTMNLDHLLELAFFRSSKTHFLAVQNLHLRFWTVKIWTIY